MNISAIINKVEETLNKQTEETKKTLHKKLDMGQMEKFEYFELNARKFASGKVDQEVSQFIYNKLSTYESTSLAERIVLTELLMSVLGPR